MLERLGFDSLSDAVYKQLIIGRHQRVDELAEHLGLPEKDVHKALERLEELDLLRPSGGELGKLVDPSLGLKALLLRQLSGIESRLQEFAEDRTAAMALIEQYADPHTGGAEPAGACLAGREAVTGRLRELAASADAEWLALVPGGGPSVSWLETMRPLEEEVRGRGVPTRTVCTDSIRIDPGACLDSDRPEEIGVLVRTVPSLPVHLLVVDRSIALLPADPADPWRSVMQISTPGVLVALTALFDGVWDGALPLGTTAKPDKHGLSPREKELLRLLSCGLTDDVIRRRLGVSLRTVRRIVADLCVRLQADSRFEAGYQAAKRGWI